MRHEPQPLLLETTTPSEPSLLPDEPPLLLDEPPILFGVQSDQPKSTTVSFILNYV
jgi:hypothetical protein